MSRNWSRQDIPDLTGSVAVVTGANRGLGLESTKALARKGATVVMACRNLQKAETARAEVLREVEGANLGVMQLDNASLASVRAFAHAFKAKYGRLDILVNNAGVSTTRYELTSDGFEKMFGVNHLGHFALTGWLLEVLKATAGARVVTASSYGHRVGKMDFDNLQYEGGEGFAPLPAYGRSKLANLLFSYELQRRIGAAGINALAVAAHPGGAKTNLARDKDDLQLRLASWFMNTFGMMQSAAAGALPTLRAATDADVQGGDFYGPAGFMEMTGKPKRVGSSKAAQNEADAKKLWEVSEELTGVRFDFTEKQPAEKKTAQFAGFNF